MPVDLHMEHLNRSVKDCLSSVGANISEDAILQCGKSLYRLIKIHKQFDSTSNIKPVSLEHSLPSTTKDEEIIIKELTETSCVFDYIPGRAHPSFKSIHPNVVQHIDKSKLIKWISDQKDNLLKEQIFVKCYGHKI